MYNNNYDNNILHIYTPNTLLGNINSIYNNTVPFTAIIAVEKREITCIIVYVV